MTRYTRNPTLKKMGRRLWVSSRGEKRKNRLPLNRYCNRKVIDNSLMRTSRNLLSLSLFLASARSKSNTLPGSSSRPQNAPASPPPSSSSSCHLICTLVNTLLDIQPATSVAHDDSLSGHHRSRRPDTDISYKIPRCPRHRDEPKSLLRKNQETNWTIVASISGSFQVSEYAVDFKCYLHIDFSVDNKERTSVS